MTFSREVGCLANGKTRDGAYPNASTGYVADLLESIGKRPLLLVDPNAR